MGHRLGIQIALPKLAAHFPQNQFLPGLFDAFGYGFNPRLLVMAEIVDCGFDPVRL